MVAVGGVRLEARVQRLFLAQGIYAERSLIPAADSGHRLPVTDIDVLVSEYGSGFHLTRRHAECKSGKRVAILDRILWLNGVRCLLGADATYFVLNSFDEDAIEFARSLDIDVMTVRQLDIWEKALGIDQDSWPCRSNFIVIDDVRQAVRKLGKQKNSARVDRYVRSTIQFIEVDSWRVFGYRKLNQLLRLLKGLDERYDLLAPSEPRRLYVRYCASALLVRFTQYLLAVCLDVSRVPVSDVQSYLLGRLTYGDQDSTHIRGLIEDTVDWMAAALNQQGIPLPAEADSSRLFRAPQFSSGLVALVEKLLESPNEASYLPIAMEVAQFGREEESDVFPRLRDASQLARELVALVRAFARASLEVSAGLLTPLGTQLGTWRGGAEEDMKDKRASSSSQSELSL